MAVKVLNIEVGKRMCKVCVSEKKGKAFSISDSFVFDTPDGAVVDGQIVSEITLGDKIKEELSNREITANEVYFSIASSKIASREISIPAVKDEQIKSIVTTNASEYFPVDVSKYSIDSLLLERVDDECRVLVVAVPIIIVESYIALADYVGFAIKALDFGANSQYQVLRGIKGEGVTMYVTVDADSSSVIFAEEGNLLMQRSLSFGGDEMICEYLAAKGEEESNYLKALDELCVSAEKPELAEDVSEYSSSLDRLVGSLARSVDFFRGGKYADKEITRVVLMGSCCHLAGLKEKIADSVGVETEWLEEVPDIQSLANSIGSISVFIGCLGARMAPMSFLPSDYVKRVGGSKKVVNNENFGYFIIAGCLIVALVLVGFPLVKNLVNKSKLKKVETEISELEYAKDKYDAYVRYTNGKKDMESFVDSSITNNANLLAFFGELEAKMPSNLNLLSASCTEESVSLNITVPSFKEAAEAIRQLRSFESIDVITVSAMSESGDNGASLVTFTVNCAYPVPETEPPTTEATTADDTVDA